MNEHSKEPQDQSANSLTALCESWLDEMNRLKAKSALLLYVDEDGVIRHNAGWSGEDGSIESIANIFVEMIAGGMGEEILYQIKEQCVLDGNIDLYDKLMTYFSLLSEELITTHEEEVEIDESQIVVPPDQTFIF